MNGNNKRTSKDLPLAGAMPTAVRHEVRVKERSAELLKQTWQLNARDSGG